MACPRYDFKPAHPRSRFCQTARQRLSEIRTNLKSARKTLATKKRGGFTKAQVGEAERRFATWFTAARASKIMYCRMCGVCVKE